MNLNRNNSFVRSLSISAFNTVRFFLGAACNLLCSLVIRTIKQLNLIRSNIHSLFFLFFLLSLYFFAFQFFYFYFKFWNITYNWFSISFSRCLSLFYALGCQFGWAPLNFRVCCLCLVYWMQAIASKWKSLSVSCFCMCVEKQDTSDKGVCMLCIKKSMVSGQNAINILKWTALCV